ncbi:MAG: PaaI family thioesterase [Frankiaceae bacterium]|nr:PaaI family thioesterase [Frankiaceae bacterium]
MAGQPRVRITDEALELWRTNDAVGFLRGWTTGLVSQGPHTEHTGNRLVEVVGPGEVVMAWTPGQQLANLSGNVHGGYLALVCDEACGLASASTGERFIPMLTLDLAVTYVRPAVVAAEHRVEGSVVHTGTTRLVTEARIFNPAGKLVATARGSFLPNKRFTPG